jgi:hypothetical protein
MKILLDWMTENGGRNYIRYRGYKNGEHKIRIGNRIANRINSHQVKTVRNGKQVVSKIQYLENTFKNAYDWANGQTGAGLLENDDVDSFNKAIEKNAHIIMSFYL